jgi:hypothetical protein
VVFIMNTGLKKSPHDLGPSFCVAQLSKFINPPCDRKPKDWPRGFEQNEAARLAL